MRELAFFVGKGGVGKTTVSAAYAVHNAVRHPTERILLLSSDPAHSLTDILQVRLDGKPRPVRLRARGRLYAWQIDAERRFREFLDEHRERILQVIEMGSIFTRDDIEPLIDSTLPGMAEVSALLAIDDAIASGQYQQIVVDTAPFGHTLRLFSLPEQFVRFLDFLELSASRDQVLAAHFGGPVPGPPFAFLRQWRSMVERIKAALAREAKVFLVTTAEKFSLNEAARCRDILAGYSPPIAIGRVVLNRVVSRGRWRTPGCHACNRRVIAAEQARHFLKQHFRDAVIYVGEDPGSPILGAAELASFGKHVFAGKSLQITTRPPKSQPVQLKRVDWPILNTELSFVLGKGGVGKTTVAAALGFATRKQKEAPVEICSVDPAPSLEDVFATQVGDQSRPVLHDKDFRASELDSAALFHLWVRELKSNIDEATTAEVSGIHVDLSFERRLLEQLLEIVPPGVDEVLAIFRILDLVANRGEAVLIDMAPTGHGLELLRMPDRILSWTRPLLKTLAMHRTLAIAREAGVKIAELAHRVRELVAFLKSPDQARVWAVMLPEPLPDRETQRLVRQLHDLRLTPQRIFVNRVLFAKDVGTCKRCRSAMAWQQATLRALKRHYSGTSVYVIRNFANEIAGKAALARFTAELWELR